ncbi:MAG: adenylate kinase family protein [Candidatus Micrarchaeia archaeon]
MRILITGTPGTGKTLVAEELGRLTGWDVLHISEIAEEASAVNHESEESTVDVARLFSHLGLVLKKKKDIIFEGHLGCEAPCPADLVVVLRTHPDELERRMEKRGYYREKIDENVMAELLDYCYQLAEKNFSCGILELDTTGRTPEACAEKIFAYISGSIDALDKVSWEDYLERRTGRPPRGE